MPFQPETAHDRAQPAAPRSAALPSPTQPGPSQPGKDPARPRLSRDRVLAAALALADDQGLDALSMRRLGQALGVEAMSLYRHVANKDVILDALVESVLAEVALPTIGEPWRTALERRAHSALGTLQRHAWAIVLLESRGSNCAAALRNREAILGYLRSRGFSLELAAHASAALDSYIYGFAVQHMDLRAEPEESPLEQLPAEEFVHLRELSAGPTRLSKHGLAGDFEWGLQLLLDGLEARLRQEPRG